MGDNKKPKQDYRDALAAQADKVIPKDPKKELVYVMILGKAVPFVRGDMSEEDWSNIKARAIKTTDDKVVTATPEATTQSQRAEGPSTSDAARIESMGKKMDSQRQKDVVRGNEDLLDLQATGSMGGGSGGGGGGGGGSEPRPLPPKKRDQGSPDEWATYPEKKKTTKSPGTQTEDDQMVGSSDPGMSPRGQMMRMAMGAHPRRKYQQMPELDLTQAQEFSTLDVSPETMAKEQTARLRNAVSQSEMAAGLDLTTPESRLKTAVDARLKQGRDVGGGVLVEEGPVSVSPVVTDNNDTSINPKRLPVQRFGGATVDESGTLAESGPVSLPKTRGPFDPVDPSSNLLSDIQSGVSEVSRVLFGGPPPPNEQQIAAREDLAAPPAGEQPASVAPTQPVPSQPGSVSMKARFPGNAQMPVTPVDPFIEQMKENARLAQQLEVSSAEIARQKIASDADLKRQAMTERARLDADNVAQQKVYEDTISQRQTALQNLQQQVMDLSRESIDPNRFWNNKDSGQKAAAVIAGALFGFTGQGMQWLQRLDSLVSQDIQAQAADLQRRRGLLGDAAGMQESLVGMAEKQGLRGQAAYNAAVAAHKEGLANQLEMNAMNYADPALRVKAEQAALAIRADAQKNIAQYQMDAQKTAMDNRLKLAQIRHLEAQNMALATKAASGEKKGKAVSPGLAMRVANTKQMILTLKNMKELAQNGGFVDRMGRKAKENLTSEENAKLKQYEAGQFEIARLRAGSSLQKPEQEALLPLLAERSGRFDPVPGLDEAIKKAEDSLRIEEETAAGATSGDLGSTESGAGDFPEVPVE